MPQFGHYELRAAQFDAVANIEKSLAAQTHSRSLVLPQVPSAPPSVTEDDEDELNRLASYCYDTAKAVGGQVEVVMNSLGHAAVEEWGWRKVKRSGQLTPGRYKASASLLCCIAAEPSGEPASGKT